MMIVWLSVSQSVGQQVATSRMQQFISLSTCVYKEKWWGTTLPTASHYFDRLDLRICVTCHIPSLCVTHKGILLSLTILLVLTFSFVLRQRRRRPCLFFFFCCDLIHFTTDGWLILARFTQKNKLIEACFSMLHPFVRLPDFWNTFPCSGLFFSKVMKVNFSLG